MALNPEQFGELFYDTLHCAYLDFLKQGVQPHEIREQDTALVFLALENCRDLCLDAAAAGINKDHLWCRYTLGVMDTKEKKKVRDLMSALRKLNPQIATASDTLSEFVFDFSITSLSIPQGYKTTEPLPAEPFQFLVIAESELAKSVDKVMEDLLRLVGANSPIKVLVFQSWGEEMSGHIEMILKRCAPKGHHKSADWFFFGVPTYSEFYKHKGDPQKLMKQVYYLPVNADAIGLRSQPEWCKWL